MVSPKPLTNQPAGSSTTYSPKPVNVAGGVDPVAATATVVGGVKRGVAVANATVAADGTSAGTQLNALLASLRAAGVIAP